MVGLLAWHWRGAQVRGKSRVLFTCHVTAGILGVQDIGYLLLKRIHDTLLDVCFSSAIQGGDVSGHDCRGSFSTAVCVPRHRSADLGDLIR